jgi:arylsulfatase A-like enzyme
MRGRAHRWLWAGSAQRICRARTKPNILVIMGDDIGWENLGSYHQGLMLDATPNLDKLAKQGLRFTDYYAEASCTAGRANSLPENCQFELG